MDKWYTCKLYKYIYKYAGKDNRNRTSWWIKVVDDEDEEDEEEVGEELNNTLLNISWIASGFGPKSIYGHATHSHQQLAVRQSSSEQKTEQKNLMRLVKLSFAFGLFFIYIRFTSKNL